MKILLFVLLPILVVTAYAVFVWARNRQPSSVESGVDAFRREMSALSPDAAPVQRRPERPERPERPGPPGPPSAPGQSDLAPRPSPRRPGGDGGSSPDGGR